jgi:hypothetical protein
MGYFTYSIINNIASFGHLLSALTMIFLYSSNSPVIIPLTESYLEWKMLSNNSICEIGSRVFNTSEQNYCIGTVTKPINCNNNNCYGIDLGWLIIFFHILSFGFQSFATYTNYNGPILGYKYSIMISNNRNPLRFIEYSFSASIMLIAIALVNGVTDINLITSIGVLTSCCQLCGLAVEYVDNIRIKWLLHITGWIQFIWAYGIIAHAFFKSIDGSNESGGVKPPSFVYVIVIILFILYSSFGFVQLSELLIDLNPYTKEKSYVLLSLTAKLLLGWMIFSNVLILGN